MSSDKYNIDNMDIELFEDISQDVVNIFSKNKKTFDKMFSRIYYEEFHLIEREFSQNVSLCRQVWLHRFYLREYLSKLIFLVDFCK